MENAKYDLGSFKEELYCSKPLFFSKFVEEKLNTYIRGIKDSRVSQLNLPKKLKTFWGEESPTPCKLKLSFMIRFKDDYQIPPSNEIHKKPVILAAEGIVKMSFWDFAKALDYDFTPSFKSILQKFPNYQKMMKSLKSAISKLFPLTLMYSYLAVINLWFGENEEIKDAGVGVSLISLNFEGKFGRVWYRDFVGGLDEKFSLLENELKQKFGEDSEDVKRFIDIWRPALLKLFDILLGDGWKIVKEWLSEIFENVDYKKAGIAMLYVNSRK
jgi:hypothetical protein